MRFLGMYIGWLLLGVGVSLVNSQTYTPPDSLKLVTVAKQIMKKVRYCALITVDSLGIPQARIVDAFPPDSQLVVWIATNPRTRKVAQIQKNPEVTLFYWDPQGVSYVTLIGKATLVADPQQKARFWKEDWKNFYSDRWSGDDYLLIRIIPLRVEVVSYEFGILNRPQDWLPPFVVFR